MFCVVIQSLVLLSTDCIMSLAANKRLLVSLLLVLCCNCFFSVVAELFLFLLQLLNFRIRLFHFVFLSFQFFLVFGIHVIVSVLESSLIVSPLFPLFLHCIICRKLDPHLHIVLIGSLLQRSLSLCLFQVLLQYPNLFILLPLQPRVFTLCQFFLLFQVFVFSRSITGHLTIQLHFLLCKLGDLLVIQLYLRS